MRMFALLLGVALLLTAPGGLAAQPERKPASSPKADEIVVTGNKSRRQQVRGFVHTLTPARADEQLARFLDPVCPAVAGLASHENEAIVARIRQVTKAAGAPLAKAACTPNLLVIATSDKRTLIGSMRRYAPGLVAGLTEDRVAALANAPGPVASWQMARLLDENGNIPRKDVITGWLEFTSVDAGRLKKMTQAAMVGAVLVVERDALSGVSTRQFADFAAMRLLAPVDPLSYRHMLAGNHGSVLPAPSILDLFGDGAPADARPPSVTWWDFAFLQALYDSSGTTLAPQQRGDIQAKMNKILASVPADEL